MEPGSFQSEAMRESHPKWEAAIDRREDLYRRPDDIRSPFARDYNRILHSTAYRRLKHKTQVFFATTNDHVCTRIEHVNHVAAVSRTIAEFLGLNPELTSAVAIGHDLGHAPFGHAGEKILAAIASEELGEQFWHERNSLRFVDYCETLPDPAGVEHNLNLTYAVRDGIVCHCGEIDEVYLRPRDDPAPLESLEGPSARSPFTWEGCVVKIADKIAFLGRDIEDALTLKILTRQQIGELERVIRPIVGDRAGEVNTTMVMHELTTDLCRSSTPETGLRLSPERLRLMTALKEFSIAHIYDHERIQVYKRYAELVLRSLYETLAALYQGPHTLAAVEEKRPLYPAFLGSFSEWLARHSAEGRRADTQGRFANAVLYSLERETDYRRAVTDYLSGMTDRFAIRCFEELTTF